MEYTQRPLKQTTSVPPLTEDEKEYASNSYLMSLVALFGGLPLPVFNLIATLIFFWGNRRTTPFVRWHCTQALLSQVFIFFFNTVAFWWTVLIVSKTREMSDHFFVYLVFVVLLNLSEIIATIYTAIRVRKGRHVRWILFAYLVDQLLKQRHDAFTYSSDIRKS